MANYVSIIDCNKVIYSYSLSSMGYGKCESYSFRSGDYCSLNPITKIPPQMPASTALVRTSFAELNMFHIGI